MSLQAHSPADMLASIPHTLGFTPKDSLVLSTITSSHALGATLRVDLPSITDTDALTHFVQLLRQDTTAVATVAVIYDDSDTPLRWKPAYLQLTDALEAGGLPLREGWLVSSTQFYSLSCEEDGCCPPMPIEAIEESAVNAALIFNGSAPAEQAGVEVPTPPEGEALAEMQALIMAVALEPLNGDPTDFGQPAIAGAMVEWGCALDDGLDKEYAAVLIAHMLRTPVRDRLIADAISAPLDDPGFRQAMIGQNPSVDWELADKYEALALRLLAYTPPGRPRADLLCLAAFVEWHKGMASNAVPLLEQAEESESGHRLTQLLLTLLAEGFVPAVAQSATAAYQRRRTND